MRAVSEGTPPSCSVTPMAMGIVANFGASDSRTSVEAPQSHPMPTAEPMAVLDPITRASASGTAIRLSRSICP